MSEIPPRLHPLLRFFGAKLGLTFSGTIGMALGHGIFIRAEYADDRALLLHELAHVAQYERLGLRRFLRQYLHECLTQGYPLGALEAEARQVTDTLLAQRRFRDGAAPGRLSVSEFRSWFISSYAA